MKRAISLLRRGHLGRAAKALFQSSPPRCDDAAIEKLRSLHPSRPTVIPAPPIPLPPPTLVDSQKLHSVLKRSATGASPGPSGWTAEHLLLLFQDKPCAEAITAITSDICNGFLPHAARDWLVGSRLIAIPKDDTGVRPISIGEALYRLASAYLSDLVTPHMPDIFSSLQKGVGVSGGADRALHATQLSLELLRAKCDPVVLAIDIKNAFNTIDRGAVARALIQQPHLHPLWRFFEWSYAHRSNLMVFDNEGSLTAHIESMQGVKQGDPVPSLLFALAVQDTFVAAVAGLPNVTAVAYLDDLQIIGDADSALQAFDRLASSLPNLSLTINPNKCKCLWPFPDRDPPSSLVTGLGARSITLREGFMEVLGGPIGLDEKAIELWCLDQIRVHDQFFALLRHPLLSSHYSLLLLKSSLRPRLNYVMRCTPPSLLAPALLDFDRSCMNLLRDKIAPRALSGAISEFSRCQISLPASEGGLGIPCLRTTSLAAFLASVAPAVQDVQHLLLPTHTDPAGGNVPATFQHLLHTTALLRSNGVLLDLPHEVAAIRSSFDCGAPPHFQSKLMTDFHCNLRHRLLTDPASLDADKARLIAASGDHASVWMHLGSLHAPSLTDGAVAAAISHRLGTSSVSLPARHCVCGAFLDATHLHACPRNKRRGILNRHDKIKRQLAYVARTAGLDVEIEPSTWVGDHSCPDDEGETKVTDLLIKGLGQPAHVDVAVVCASAPTHCTRVAKAQSCAPVLRDRQSQKLSHYRDLVKQESATFHAFVLTSCGGFSDPAKSLLKAMASYAADHHPLFNYHSFYHWSVALVAGALQEGNRAVDVRGASLQH